MVLYRIEGLSTSRGGMDLPFGSFESSSHDTINMSAVANAFPMVPYNHDDWNKFIMCKVKALITLSLEISNAAERHFPLFSSQDNQRLLRPRFTKHK